MLGFENSRSPRFVPHFLMHKFCVQFFRTMTGYSRWMPAVVGFVKWCEWTQLSLLFTRGPSFKSTAKEFSRELLLAKLSVIASMSFDEEVDADDQSLVSQLQGIEDRRSSKVVVAMALESTYWKIALAAHERGMARGWAWLGLDTVDESATYAFPEKRATVDLAFNGWIYFEPHVSAGLDFFDRVHNATRFDFPTVLDESAFSASPYAVAMYDAIILFATVANQQRWRPEQGGTAFLNQSSGNVSFVGATGLVTELDANGDSLLSYQAINLVLKNGALQPIAVGMSTAGTQSYLSNGIPIIWPGGLLSGPADAAVAVADGYTKWILIGGGVSAVVVVAGVTVLVRKRHAHLQAIMLQLFTEVSPVPSRIPLTSAETPVVIPIRPAASPVCSLVTRPRALRPSWH